MQFLPWIEKSVDAHALPRKAEFRDEEILIFENGVNNNADDFLSSALANPISRTLLSVSGCQRAVGFLGGNWKPKDY